MYYYHPDHIGSTTYVTDSAGEDYEHLEYTPDGETRIEERTNLHIIGYRYTSKELDTETGLYYFGARYLDPQTSRWISPDPALKDYLPTDGNIEDLPGQCGVFSPINLSLYQYGTNNPLKYIDPNGLKNYVIISTFRGGGLQDQGTNFLDAVETRANEIRNSKDYNPKIDTVSVYHIESKEQFVDMVNEGNIDKLEMFVHEGSTYLTIGAGEGPGKREYFYASDLKKLNKNAFNEGAKMILHQSKSASEKTLPLHYKMFGWLFGGRTIAEKFAEYFKGLSVTGYTGGAIAVPSLDAEIDLYFKHKKGEPVWYKTWGGKKLLNMKKKRNNKFIFVIALIIIFSSCTKTNNFDKVFNKLVDIQDYDCFPSLDMDGIKNIHNNYYKRILNNC